MLDDWKEGKREDRWRIKRETGLRDRWRLDGAITEGIDGGISDGKEGGLDVSEGHLETCESLIHRSAYDILLIWLVLVSRQFFVSALI
jgi:hypothetical protein